MLIVSKNMREVAVSRAKRQRVGTERRKCFADVWAVSQNWLNIGYFAPA